MTTVGMRAPRERRAIDPVFLGQLALPLLLVGIWQIVGMLAGDFYVATPVQAFWQIFVPLSLPGLAAGIIIVFVLCLGFYVTPALLGGGRVMMWSMQIERNVSYHSDWGAASALGVVLLVLTLGVLWAVGRLIGFDRIVGSR